MRRHDDSVSDSQHSPLAQRQRGFTLIEMAVAVFIITLLLGSILVPLTTQVEQRQISDTQKALEEIKEALDRIRSSHGRLSALSGQDHCRASAGYR